MKKAINIFYVALAVTFLGVVYYVVDYKGLGQKKLNKLLNFDDHTSKSTTNEMLLKTANDRINQLEKKFEEHIKEHNSSSKGIPKSKAKENKLNETFKVSTPDKHLDLTTFTSNEKLKDLKNDDKIFKLNEMNNINSQDDGKENLLDLVKLLAKDNERDMILKDTINLINQKLVYPSKEYEKNKQYETKKSNEPMMNKSSVLNAFENKFKGNVVDLTPNSNQNNENFIINNTKNNNSLENNLNETSGIKKQPMDIFGTEIFNPFNFTNMQKPPFEESYDKKVPPYDNISDLTDILPRSNSNLWHPVFFEPIRRFNDAPKIIPINESDENPNVVSDKHLKEKNKELNFKPIEVKVEKKDKLNSDNEDKRINNSDLFNLESTSDTLFDLDINKNDKKEEDKTSKKDKQVSKSLTKKKQSPISEHKSITDDSKDNIYTAMITTNQIKTNLDDSLVKDIMKEFNDRPKDLSETIKEKKNSKSKNKISSKKKSDNIDDQNIKFENNNDQLTKNSVFPFKKTEKNSVKSDFDDSPLDISKNNKNLNNKDNSSSSFQVLDDKNNVLIKKEDDGEIIFSNNFPVHNDINAFVENKNEKKDDDLKTEKFNDDDETLSNSLKNNTKSEKNTTQSDYTLLSGKNDKLAETLSSVKNLSESDA